MENGSKIAGLEALRGLACVMVLITHVPTYLTLPHLLHEVLAIPLLGIGVDLFFVISGFVTAQSFARLTPGNMINRAGAFWRRRFIRLLPLLVIVVTTTICLSFFIGGTSWQESLWGVVFLANLGRVWGGSSSHSMLTPLWSVATEMQFYLFVPVLACLSLRGLRLAVLTTLLIGICWARSWGDPAWYWRPEAFLLGHLLFAEGGLRARLAINPSIIALPVPLMGLAIVGRLFQNNGGGLYIVMVALTCAAMVALGLKMKPAPLFEWIGRRSYALYLIHVPVLYACAMMMPWIVALPVAILTTLLTSHVLTVTVDEPLQRALSLRKRSSPARAETQAAVP